MAFHPKWVSKYRAHYKPSFFDNVNRRWDSKEKVSQRNYRSQDPLFFDNDLKHVNGGIPLLLEFLHDKGNY